MAWLNEHLTLVGAIVVAVSGFAAAVGGLAAAFGAFREQRAQLQLTRQLATKSEEIAAKSGEIARLATENAALSQMIAAKSDEIAALNRGLAQKTTDLILGKEGAFCQLTVYIGEPGWYISTYHHGLGNIYDVQVLIHEVREDGTPRTQLQRVVIGTLTRDTWPSYLMLIGQPDAVALGAPRYFSAQITQRNGTSLQDIVVYPKRDGRVELGFLRLTFNGKSYDPDFRLLPQGAAGVIVPPDEIKRVFGLRKRETFIFGGPPKEAGK